MPAIFKSVMTKSAGFRAKAARPSVPLLQAQPGAGVVNISSVASMMGRGSSIAYMASKGALNAMTIGLAKEVAAEGIRVNAVRPGLIETEIHASGGLPNRVRDLQHQVPMQRGGTADEVAETIVWLLSPAASYTTMSLLDVSGGR